MPALVRFAALHHGALRSPGFSLPVVHSALQSSKPDAALPSARRSELVKYVPQQALCYFQARFQQPAAAPAAIEQVLPFAQAVVTPEQALRAPVQLPRLAVRLAVFVVVQAQSLAAQLQQQVLALYIAKVQRAEQAEALVPQALALLVQLQERAQAQQVEHQAAQPEPDCSASVAVFQSQAQQLAARAQQAVLFAAATSVRQAPSQQAS